MKIALGLILAAVVCSVAPSSAASTRMAKQHTLKPQTSAVWAQEPTSFLGFKLHQPATASCEECPQDAELRLRDYGLGKKPCFERLGADFAKMYLWHAPDVGVRLLDMTMLTAEADTVEGLIVDYYRFDYDKFRDLLIARYGAPTDSSVLQYQNAMGGNVQGRSTAWRSPTCTMELTERSTDPDDGALTITTSRLAEWRERRNKLNAERNKAKL